MTALDLSEPTIEDLEAIESEWPVLAAELAVVEAAQSEVAARPGSSKPRAGASILNCFSQRGAPRPPRPGPCVRPALCDPSARPSLWPEPRSSVSGAASANASAAVSANNVGRCRHDRYVSARNAPELGPVHPGHELLVQRAGEVITNLGSPARGRSCWRALSSSRGGRIQAVLDDGET